MQICFEKEKERVLSDRYVTSKQIPNAAGELITTGEEKVIVCVTCSFNYTVYFPVQLGVCNR